MSKKTLGQFYTTNYDYILSNMIIPDNIETIIEPFVGKGDLLNFIKNKNNFNIEIYDIDPKYKNTIKCDTLLNSPNYDNKFVLTNPPYLARNKNTDKTLYDKYNTNDLYKCFIINLINSVCLGGIIIIPLNFISSIRKSDIELRRQFINKFNIITLNIFEEQVFNDTSYTICSLQFELKKKENIISTNIYIYPNNIKSNIIFNEKNDYTIGGEIYNLPKNDKIKIERATYKNSENSNITNILVKCIDDNINSTIGLSWVSNEKIYIDNTPKLSARSYATLIIEPKLNNEEQKKLIYDFNNYINQMRNKYNSLFLTNYRESNTIARKRISFQLIYDICNYLLASK